MRGGRRSGKKGKPARFHRPEVTGIGRKSHGEGKVGRKISRSAGR